ncbi:MAG TPA: dihydrolipoamide acetyltransferase family protein [Anaerolineales bacterium]|nr:dihydrolipoamide acetyltransferase family protein [Anaerolineales bacterium]
MATVVSMPKLGFDMAEGTLVRWVKAVGDSVAKGEVLAEIETDKATVEVESLAAGTVRKHLVNEGTSVPVGTPIAVVGTADESIEGIDASAPAEPPARGGEGEPLEGPEQAASADVPAPAGPKGQVPGGVRASPLARRMAEQNALDLAGVTGTGPGGRVTRRDVMAAISDVARKPTRPAPAIPPGVTARVPVTRLRATIGRRMTAAKQQVPHFYLTADIDAAALASARSEANAFLPEAERLSVNDFVVRACALALRDFPPLNASLDGEEIVRHGDINIGSAVAVESGLLTVVVRQAQAKSLQEISQELRSMVARAREGKVRPEDIEGSTFTVSNLGMLDVDEFVAIINPPEAAILAVGALRDVPVVQGDQVVPGKRLKVTLSADHRVTDGAEAARWLQILRGYLEHPLRLFL